MKYALVPKPLVRDSAGRYSGASAVIGFEVMGFPAAVIADVKPCGGRVIDFHVLVWQKIQNVKELVVFSSRRNQGDVRRQGSGCHRRV